MPDGFNLMTIFNAYCLSTGVFILCSFVFTRLRAWRTVYLGVANTPVLGLAAVIAAYLIPYFIYLNFILDLASDQLFMQNLIMLYFLPLMTPLLYMSKKLRRNTLTSIVVILLINIPAIIALVEAFTIDRSLPYPVPSLSYPVKQLAWDVMTAVVYLTAALLITRRKMAKSVAA